MKYHFTKQDILSEEDVLYIKDDWLFFNDHQDNPTSADYLFLTVARAMGAKYRIEQDSFDVVLFENVARQFPHPQLQTKVDHYPYSWGHIIPIIDSALLNNFYWVYDDKIIDKVKRILIDMRMKIVNSKFEIEKVYRNDDEQVVFILVDDNSPIYSEHNLKMDIVEASFKLGQKTNQQFSTNFVILSVRETLLMNIHLSRYMDNQASVLYNYALAIYTTRKNLRKAIPNLDKLPLFKM